MKGYLGNILYMLGLISTFACTLEWLVMQIMCQLCNTPASVGRRTERHETGRAEPQSPLRHPRQLDWSIATNLTTFHHQHTVAISQHERLPSATQTADIIAQIELPNRVGSALPLALALALSPATSQEDRPCRRMQTPGWS